MISGRDKKHVVVAMSGGVDSSTVAALLRRQGFRVTGLTMSLWPEKAPDYVADAREVAMSLDIPLHVVDFSQRFKGEVIDYFLDAYMNCSTPNPCVVCNEKIKFGLMLREAKKLGADLLATGHYLKVEKRGDRFLILKSEDLEKDQSYFVYRVSQEALSQVIFPLGSYRKSEVRKMAEEFGLSVANRSESQDLCFLRAMNYRTFLADRLRVADREGPIRDVSGREIGVHRGLTNYTVGQRRGLGVSSSEPLYVIGLNASDNALCVGHDRHRFKRELSVKETTFVSGDEPQGEFEASVKIRYSVQETLAMVFPLRGNRAVVKFHQPVKDVTPGQSAVFYQGNSLIGGGVIV